jgi:WD40 repeat protein/tRNA A-37 threonylcarbamoyl transferase component Bud32
MMKDDSSIFAAGPEKLNRLFSLALGELQAPEPPAASPDATAGQATVSVDAASERPGGRIGRYKLLRVLGEGGMGIVYLAEQEEPVKRQVALKVIKPGMDSKRVIARFEAEQQALALMDHPHVAQVYDAGLTLNGRPYFVMEYVKGIPVTEHCDKYQLTIEDRLRLFLHVCEAIRHAHQKGIIHRDLKPSNILVTIEGNEAIPKVIDFGVARAISQPLTERTLYTEQGQLVGTPEYMSPEQVEMSNQDIDTRADIYSLGVVLYELIAGVLPFDPQALREGGFDHIRKVICEEEPKTPSTRLSKTSVEESAQSARCRRISAKALQRRLHGDLDWIVMKAMEKDRARRYGTAQALAEDIERHLNNELVLAGRPGTLYRFQKLVRRNKGVFAGVAVVAAVLVLGALASTWQAVRATQAKRAESRLRQQVQAEAYASDMSLAQQALAMNDLGRARGLLEGHRPKPGEVDLRGWEWRYLWRECRSDALGDLCRYPNSAYSVAYSPNGKVLAVGGLVQEFVDIWDVPGRRRIATLQPKEGRLVAFSPRGDLLATDQTQGGYRIRLWRTDTWECVQELDTGGRPVVVFRFSPDGTRLASMSYPDEVTVWEVDQWVEIRRIRGVRLVGVNIGALDFSPDGKALVIGDANHRLQVIDLASGNKNFDIPEAHTEGITAVAWSPTGSVIASGSGYTGGPIRLWDAASGKPLGKLEGHTDWICELIFSTDGLRLYSASGDQTIRIWDVGAQQLLATLRGSGHEVLGLVLSPDGATLASACKDGVVAFWSALPRPEEELPTVIALSELAQPAFAPDSRVLAVPRAGTVSLFDLATSQEIEQLPALGPDVGRVAYSPDGTLLVSGSVSGKIRVWSCAGRRLLQELEGQKEQILLLRFRADGTRLLSLDARGKAIWWDALTWQAGQTFVVELPGGAAVSPDGRLLAISHEGALHWLNAEAGELLARTAGPPGPPYPAMDVAFSGDGSRVASVSVYGTVALWDPSSFQLIASFKGHMVGALAVAFSADGRRLATGGATSRDAVKLWDLSTHRELMTLPGQGTAFLSVVFSPDGRWLAACSRDEGKLHLWRAPSWAEIEAAENRTARVRDVATAD